MYACPIDAQPLDRSRKGGYHLILLGSFLSDGRYKMVDNFDVDGPNGKYQCLVFELLGPSLPEMIETRFSDGRLSGKIAKFITE
jgi:hypothetical protein